MFCYSVREVAKDRLWFTVNRSAARVRVGAAGGPQVVRGVQVRVTEGLFNVTEVHQLLWVHTVSKNSIGSSVGHFRSAQLGLLNWRVNFYHTNVCRYALPPVTFTLRTERSSRSHLLMVL